MTRHLLTSCTAAALTLAAASTARADGEAAAPNKGMNQVNASVQRDELHNQQVLATLGLAVSERGWVRLGGGQSRSEQAGTMQRPSIASAALGWLGDGWQLSGGAAQRRNGARLRQTDWMSSLEWRPTGAVLGADLMHRSAHAQGTVSTTAQGGTANLPVAEDIRGNGVGLHGALQLSERLQLFGAGMWYHNRVTATQNGAATGSASGLPGVVDGLLGNKALLAQTLLSRASAVTRDEAVLDHSAQVGASYRVNDQLAFTGEYLVDKVQAGGDTLHSVQVKAAFGFANLWTLTPTVGRSHSGQAGGVNYGALSIGYGW